MNKEQSEKRTMKNKHKSKLKHFWDRVIADAKMDNATKARIAEETVQDIVSGLQNMLNPDEYFRRNSDIHSGSSEKTAKETRTKSLSSDFELEEYRGTNSEENEKKYSGRLFILRKNPNSERNSSTAEESDK